MPARRNRFADPFMRAYVLGRMYERGRPITTERVRRLFGVSPATAKRDLAALRRLGATLPRKPIVTAPIARLMFRDS